MMETLRQAIDDGEQGAPKNGNADQERTCAMRRTINRDRVRELREAGVSVSEIAAQLGCGKSGVSKILKSMRGPTAETSPVAVTDPRLVYLWQLLYDHVWKLKKQGFPGIKKELLLDRLKILADVVRE